MNADPNPSNGKKPNGDAPVRIEITPVQGLKSPPRCAAGYRVRELFVEGTAQAYREIGDILYSTKSRPVLAYIGATTAAALSPKTIPLAMEIMNLRSLAATGEFLTVLADREFGGRLTGSPPTLKGRAFAPLRAKIADFAVSPDCYVRESEWERREDEVVRLTTFPITILRACAQSEVDPILIKGATRGGVGRLMNRRVLELLLLREGSEPHRRVLPGSYISEIARATDDVLRNSFNRMQLMQLVDLWLSKPDTEGADSTADIRGRLVSQWREYQRGGESPDPDEPLPVYDTIRLLRRLDDPESRRALAEAADDRHVGVALLARLCNSGGSPEDLSALASALAPSASLSDNLMASRVFAYPVSAEVDARVWPIFKDYIDRIFAADADGSKDEEGLGARRRALLFGLVRRFYSERFDSPFLQEVFGSWHSNDQALSTVAINTLVQAAETGLIPSPTFYDRPEKLGALQRAISLLSKAGQENGDAVAAHLAQKMQELFVLQGSAAYGFELETEVS